MGRVLDRLYDMSTMKIFTACAVRAGAQFGVECRDVHFKTTSRSLWGDDQCAEEQDVPLRVTYGYSKAKRPDLKQFVLSLLCVDRTVPIGGKPEDGNASAKTLNTTLLSEIATILTRHGVAPGASIDVADAALVTEDNLVALGNTLFISRLPATYTECERVIQEAVVRDDWEAIGILATTRATKHRPATYYTASEGEVALYGKTYRAIVVHATAPDKWRLPRLAREVHASAEGLQAVVRVAETHAYVCQADAEVAAARLRASQTPYHDVVVRVEERQKYGQSRPRKHTPRAVKPRRYGLKCTLNERDATMGHQRAEAGCFVLLTNVPTEGDLTHRAGEVLRGYKNQHGIEQNFSFLKDPLIVNSLFLKKPERIEALGLVLLLALLLWRLMERSLRPYVDTTGTTMTGWDKKTTDRPTAFMMGTKFSGLIVVKVDQPRHLARALSSVQQQYLTALNVPGRLFHHPHQG